MKVAIRPETRVHCDCHDMGLVLMADNGNRILDVDVSYEDAKAIAVAILQELARNDVHGVAPAKDGDVPTYVVTV